jgi:hypothetical protein
VFLGVDLDYKLGRGREHSLSFTMAGRTFPPKALTLVGFVVFV